MYRAPTARRSARPAGAPPGSCFVVLASVVSREYMKEGRVTSGAEAPFLFNRLRGSSFGSAQDKLRSHLLKTNIGSKRPQAGMPFDSAQDKPVPPCFFTASWDDRGRDGATERARCIVPLQRTPKREAS